MLELTEAQSEGLVGYKASFSAMSKCAHSAEAYSITSPLAQAASAARLGPAFTVLRLIISLKVIA